MCRVRSAVIAYPLATTPIWTMNYPTRSLYMTCEHLGRGQNFTAGGALRPRSTMLGFCMSNSIRYGAEPFSAMHAATRFRVSVLRYTGPTVAPPFAIDLRIRRHHVWIQVNVLVRAQTDSTKGEYRDENGLRSANDHAGRQ